MWSPVWHVLTDYIALILTQSSLLLTTPLKATAFPMSERREVAGKEKQASATDGKMSVNSFTTYRYLINAIRDTFDTPSGYRRFDRTSSKSLPTSKSQSSASHFTSSHNTSRPSEQPPANMSSQSSKYSAPRSSYSMLITLAIYLLLLHHTAGNAAPE